jgi:hypothetical protein
MNTDLHRFGRAFALVKVGLVLVLAGCARTGTADAVHRAESPGLSTDPPGRIEFEGRNLFRTVPHTFENWKFVRVELEDGPGTGLSGEVEIEIDLTSVQTGYPRLNRKAMSAEFFDVERFPTARLWIGNVRPAASPVEASTEGIHGNGSGAGGPLPERRYHAEMEIDLRGVRWRGDFAFEVRSASPRVVAGEVALSRGAFGIGSPHRRWNPFSIRDEVLVRFEARIRQ